MGSGVTKVKAARRGGVVAGALALAMMAGLTWAPGVAHAQEAVAPVLVAGEARAMTGSAWGEALWTAARSGDEAEFDRLLRLTEKNGAIVDGDDGAIAAARALLTSFSQREEQRTKQLGEVRKDLDELLAGELNTVHIIKALREVVELQSISPEGQKDALLLEEPIANLMKLAETTARESEAAGRSMDATELFVLLDLLTEAQGTFRPDVRRMAQRQEMLRTYVPRRLWEMANERRTAAGEKPLPAYNDANDNFTQRLAGVSRSTLERSLSRSREHVERIAINSMMLAGLETLRTMVGTPDLSAAAQLAGLGDQARRDAMLAYLAREIKSLSELPTQLDNFQVVSLLDRVMENNARTVSLPEAVIVHEFGNGAFGKLDEYSAIIWPDEVARFNKNTQARFVGVGIQIEFDETQNVRVVTPIEGTPAQRAGIHRGDLITKVNGKGVLGLSLDQVVDRITGPMGSQVTLTIERPTKGEGSEGDAPAADAEGTTTLEFTLTRATINVATVVGWERSGAAEDAWDWFVDREAGVGYVRLRQFSDRTTAELDRALSQMNAQPGVRFRGLIVDLRFNPGGLLDQAVSVAQRLLPFDDAPIVSARRGDGREVVEGETDSRRANLAHVPVIVLVNEGSASASEIVSGAIRVYSEQRGLDAIVLGARTFGKGSVQNVWPITADSLLKLTTAYYMLPDRSIIHKRPGSKRWGVEPSLHVEMLPKQTSDSITLRREADVIPINENGVAPAAAGAAAPLAKASDLLDKGIDLQLQAAVALLRARLAADRASIVQDPRGAEAVRRATP